MSMSINRNMEPRHRQPKASGGAVMQTIRITFDTVPTCYPAYAISPGDISMLPLELDMVKLAALLGETITVADVIDNSGGTLKTKNLPFSIHDITVGTTVGSSSHTMHLVSSDYGVTNAGKFYAYLRYLNCGTAQQQATKNSIDTQSIDLHIMHSSTVPQQHLITANYSTLT